MITRELALAPVEFIRVHAATSAFGDLIGDERMEHFVIEDVFEEPARDPFLIEPRVDPDDAIFLLDGAENEVGFRPTFALLAPNDFVIPQSSAEMAGV